MSVVVNVDRKSFPIKCPELDDILSLINAEVRISKQETPTSFFQECMAIAEEAELVIPVTRNMYVRDKLRVEGVTTVLCL